MAGILDNSYYELTYVLQYLPYKEDRMMLGLSCKSIYQTIQKNASSTISTYKSSYASFASERGYLSCLKYGHENGCSWDTTTSYLAAREGHLDCLKYVHENGCPWDSFTCSNAASKGHLECLKYAHWNGCPLEGKHMFLRSQ